jgi:cyclophilin family peptidyl-prolyl cis-trans isomerase/HEAT repeat protein
VLVTVEGEGAGGMGECVADANPSYSAESPRTAWQLIADVIAPLLLGRESALLVSRSTPGASRPRPRIAWNAGFLMMMTMTLLFRPHVTLRGAAALALVVTLPACATTPDAPPPGHAVEQKLAWILQLEDQRILRLDPPAVPEPPPSRRPRPAVPVVQPADLTLLLADTDAGIRRRAALAIGRVGLPEGVELLAAKLTDPDPDVRQMVAFGLGLLADASAAGPLRAALADPDPLVRGRAAEALGSIGAREAADDIGRLAAEYARSAPVASMQPDDEGWPAPAEADAFRLALYALVRLRAYEPLAAAALDGGRPVTDWWPVAFAFQRIGDPRAQIPLTHLLGSRGKYTKSFAARGLGALRDRTAVDALLPLASPGQVPLEVVVSAVRALAQIGDPRGVAPIVELLRDGRLDPNIRLEAVTALGTLRAVEGLPYIEDYATDQWSTMRIAALRAAAAIDPDHFVVLLGSLEADRDWTVRAALAEVLATLSPEVALERLEPMLDDEDRRVIPAVLRALARAKWPQAGPTALRHLEEPDYALRAAAAGLVGQIRPAGGVEALRAAWKEALADAANDARLAILNALTAFGAADAQDIVRAALEDRDWAVRLRARELLSKLDPEADYRTAIRPAPGSPPAAYDDPRLLAPPYSPRVFIETVKGTIEFELAVLDAPQTSMNFMNLARRGFFNGLRIHRVVPNFVVQDGDPRGDGQGGPGYTIRDELNDRPYVRGTVGMALSGPDTGGSQFFITHSPAPHLDGRYTAFGRVINGMDVVDRIQQGDTIQRVRVWDGTAWQ